MPYANGGMYPEIHIYPIDNKELVIVLNDISDKDALKLVNKISLAKTYIEDKFNDLCHFSLYVRSSEVTEANKEIYGYKTFSTLGTNKQAIREFATLNNIDVFYSHNKGLILDLYKDNPSFELAQSIEQLELEIEAFLTGKNISWSLNSPAWNSTWLNKSMDNQSLTNVLYTLLNTAQGKLAYNPKQIGLVRALLNKAGHIRHCEENLVALVQKKNYSLRNCRVTNSYGYDDYYDYSFELNYHLGNYYFLISGCLDVLGRLLASIYEIKLSHAVKPNVERQEFQNELQSKSEELYSLYSEQSLNDWMVSLKRKRNFVAHESEASYTDILKPKREKITNAEVKKRVNALRDWNSMKALIGDGAVESQKKFTEFVIRMKEDNEVLVKDAMVFSYHDDAKLEQQALFYPLIDIKFDYEKIETILKRTANTLIDTTRDK